MQPGASKQGVHTSSVRRGLVEPHVALEDQPFSSPSRGVSALSRASDSAQLPATLIAVLDGIFPRTSAVASQPSILPPSTAQVVEVDDQDNDYDDQNDVSPFGEHSRRSRSI